MLLLRTTLRSNTQTFLVRPALVRCRPITSNILSRPCQPAAANHGRKASSMVFKAAVGTMTGAGSSLFFKRPVSCQGVFAGGIGEDPLGASMGLNGVGRPASGDDKDKEASKALFHKGELSFGVVLGFCTGYLIKKVGKLFALAVGAGFIFLQYMSMKGYVTVHWDRMESSYQRQLDVDKDGKVTHRDVRSRWKGVVSFLTQNIQFKSTFLIGLYAGIRYG